MDAPVPPAQWQERKRVCGWLGWNQKGCSALSPSALSVEVRNGWHFSPGEVFLWTDPKHYDCNTWLLQPTSQTQCSSLYIGRSWWAFWSSFQTSSGSTGRRALLLSLSELNGVTNSDPHWSWSPKIWSCWLCPPLFPLCVRGFALSLEVHNELFGLADVERQVVVWTSWCQSSYLCSLGRLVSIISIFAADNGIGAFFPIQTTCGLTVRKSRIHLHRSHWCVVIAIASSVDLFGL